MEHIKMSILQLYIEDYSEPWKDHCLDSQYTAWSGSIGQTRTTAACLPQLQLMLGHLLNIVWLKSSLTLKG
jgi:hypothetical protein